MTQVLDLDIGFAQLRAFTCQSKMPGERLFCTQKVKLERLHVKVKYRA
ncbi:MAG: hypothetical protein LBD84_04705 [Campylobacteraceae bacterium]|nr:hypothetical protein [Campylobacteraceae bacterium]